VPKLDARDKDTDIGARLCVGRRDLLARLLGALVVSLAAAPFSSPAYAQQQPRPRRIGILLMAFSPDSRETVEFRRALEDAGYSEGEDVVIEWREARATYDRLPALAADLVERGVDVIVVDGTPGALAAKRATSTIPIVMTIVADPIATGLVTNLARPTGNVTGMSLMSSEVWAKRLQLLKETVPGLTRVAVLGNPKIQWYSKAMDSIKAAARSYSIQIMPIAIQTVEEIAPAFSTISRARAQALYVLSDSLFIVHRPILIKLTSNARLPAMFGERRFTDEGGLMSYGPNWADAWRRAAGYVDRILKGTKPSDLPIEQPTKLELVVNVRSAKAMGLNVPESVLLQADEVIR
jgi:putative ABC transport system substrate-binding protein